MIDPASSGGRLVVLGGSSPFTVSLIDALAADHRLPRHHLVLQGRTEKNLKLVGRYAERRLGQRGWSVDIETRPDCALRGADLVVHQNRYGGVSGRVADEAVALRFGVQPDETLGPSALNSILRAADEIRATGRLLAATCPKAWVINLSNPLSVATSLLARAGVSRCVGLCELPLVTAHRAAKRLGVPFDDVDWAYVGLNHRGFIVELTRGDRDLIAELAGDRDTSDFEAVPLDEIACLQAIPTKYHRLLLADGTAPRGRAREVASLRARAIGELDADPETPPRCLQERYMDWYPRSVVPFIAALRRAQPSREVVNSPDQDGVTREGHALVSSAGVKPLPAPTGSAGVTRWLTRLERSERAFLEAAIAPSYATIQAAVEADPIVPDGLVEVVARHLSDSCERST